MLAAQAKNNHLWAMKNWIGENEGTKREWNNNQPTNWEAGFLPGKPTRLSVRDAWECVSVCVWYS